MAQHPPLAVAGGVGLLLAQPVGEGRFTRLREALLNHPWRLPKEVTYLFDWIAQMIRELLHPRPKIQLAPE